MAALLHTSAGAVQRSINGCGSFMLCIGRQAARSRQQQQKWHLTSLVYPFLCLIHSALSGYNALGTMQARS